MNERIKSLRKELKLNQTEFANSIGVTPSNISKIESGAINTVTSSMIKLICNLYDVNEEWLRNGEGEMFNTTENALISTLKDKYNLSDIGAEILKRYLHLRPEQREDFEKVLISLCQDAEN